MEKRAITAGLGGGGGAFLRGERRKVGSSSFGSAESDPEAGVEPDTDGKTSFVRGRLRGCGSLLDACANWEKDAVRGTREERPV